MHGCLGIRASENLWVCRRVEFLLYHYIIHAFIHEQCLTKVEPKGNYILLQFSNCQIKLQTCITLPIITKCMFVHGMDMVEHSVPCLSYMHDAKSKIFETHSRELQYIAQKLLKLSLTHL